MTRATDHIGDGVAAVLDDYAAAWSARDLQRVADMWDEQDREATYVAEELGQVLVGPERIAEHLLRTENRLAAARVSIREVQARALTEDLVLATFLCRWEFDWVTYSRVGVVLRRRGPGWRFVHYMESPFHLEDWDTGKRDEPGPGS